ncbi:aromatic amino acid aminotransferase-like protein [Talaromyces proteolyticus]|uniref:Aromatic amino acid aminotransferase-like protein n=1 Tax=Talaromyces proteolyticus TaxID=1131652 RepID=A0AAD4KWD9_9EURO|nr:aromatic amino acid aminotransferase-like protein [Talaromyces proteolyticus]KAH8698422.1 aromatic amino acid aminotransferase-like protein [Talaromyces proteolyticus]
MESQDLSHHFSKAARSRVPNVMKEYYRFLRVPEMGSFAGGSPCPDYFPFDTLEFSVVHPESLSVKTQANGSTPHAQVIANKVSIQRSVQSSHVSQQIDLDTALQYGIASGNPALYAWLHKLLRTVRHPDVPYTPGPKIIICGGSADGLSKIYDVFFDPWEEGVHKLEDRQGLLVEEFVYPPALAQLKPKAANIVPVKMDSEGLLVDGPGGLLDVLENWNLKKGKRPHMFYSVPTGQNPTSGVLSYQRRKQIYEVCSKFDVLIVEDDPYWNLYYPSSTSRSAQDGEHAIDKIVSQREKTSTGYKFLDELIPSFLEIDTDGRVIRIDTFSKTIAPGCRLGYITAQPGICEQLFRVTDATTQQPSGFVQAIIAKILSGLNSSVENPETNGDKCQQSALWGFDGWVHWVEGLRDKYQQRMITMATIFEQNRHIITESDTVPMFHFSWPRGGMFIWVKINIFAHSLASSIDTKRLMLALWILCTQIPYRIIMNPGKDFAANAQIRDENAYQYLRFCFAAVDEKILVSKSKAFTEACKAFWKFNRKEDIDRILEEEDKLSRGSNGEVQTADDVERMVLEDW